MVFPVRRGGFSTVEMSLKDPGDEQSGEVPGAPASKKTK